MKRNLEEATVVFNSNITPEVLSVIPSIFSGDVVIHGDLCGEGDVIFNGGLWVEGKIKIDGDLTADFIDAKGIVCDTLISSDINCVGDITCCECTILGNLDCICSRSYEGIFLGAVIDCEADITVLGNVICRVLDCGDATIKGELSVLDSIVAGDLSVRGNLYCSGNIMADDIVGGQNIFCGKDINSESDITVKDNVLCKNISAIDIGIDKDLFCDNITARDIKVGGIMQSERIEASSFNLD